MSGDGENLADARVVRYAWFAALLLGGAWLLYRVRGTFPIFLLGFFIAYAFDPLLDRLQSRGWKRIRAVQLVFVGFLALLAVVAFVVIPLVIGQVEDFQRHYRESYRQTIAGWTADWESHVESVTPDRLRPLLFEADPETAESSRLRPVIVDRLSRFRDRVVPRALQALAGWTQRSLGGLVLLLLLPIIAFYFMNEFDPLRRRALFLVPAANRPTALAMARDVNRVFSRYFRGQMLISAAFSLAAMLLLGLWALIFGMRFTFVLGLFGGLFYLVPFVGMAVNVSLGAGIGYLTGSNPLLTAILAASTFLLLNFCFDNFLVPRLMGRELGLHPLMVMFALLAGGEFGGVLGMVVAVPVAGALKAALAHLFPQLTDPVSAEVVALVPTAGPPKGSKPPRR